MHRAHAQETPNARFLLQNDGRAAFLAKKFFAERPSRFWDWSSAPARAFNLDSSSNQFDRFSVLDTCIAFWFLVDPSRVTRNAWLALNCFASRLTRPSALELSVRRCDCRLALVVLVAKRLNISLIKEGAPIGYLHDVVHIGAWGGAARPLAGGVCLEGPGTQGGPGGSVRGVGLEPPGMCRWGPGRVGGAPRCAGGGQPDAPRVGASRGRHGRRHGSSVRDGACGAQP